MYNEKQAARRDDVLHFMVNPVSHSGHGMRLWETVEKTLQEKQVAYQVHFSQKVGDMAEIARTLTQDLEEGQECSLVVLGGDGTVNEAIQGICNFERVRFSCLPTGSGNDLVRNMKIPKKLEKALHELLENGQEHLMDMGYVSWEEGGQTVEHRFLGSCGIGYDAAVCAEVDVSPLKGILNRLGLGKIAYLSIGLKNMLTCRYAKTSVVLDGIRKQTLNRMLFVAMMSHRFEGGGFCFCPNADYQDGKLDLCIVDGIPHWKFPIIIPFALKGKHLGFKGVDAELASTVEIKTDCPLWLHTDGEVLGEHDKIVVRVERKKLRFVC